MCQATCKVCVQDPWVGGRRESACCCGEDGRRWLALRCSWRSRRPLAMCCAAVGTGACSRQQLGGAPASQPAVRAANGIDACHALEEGGGVLRSLRVGSRHRQGGASRCQPLGLERRAEQSVVTDAFEAWWQRAAGSER